MLDDICASSHSGGDDLAHINEWVPSSGSRHTPLAPMIRTLLRQGISRADIAAQLGATLKHIAEVARCAGMGNAGRSYVWTEDHQVRLIELIGRKLSASQIGRELGFSRNAVIGKCNRMGLRLASSPDPDRPRTKYKTPRRRHGTYQRKRPPNLSPIQELFFTEAVDVPRDFSADMVSFMDAGPDQCRWPIGDPASSAFRFCGSGVLGKHSYCPRHCRLAYRPNKDRGQSVPNYLRKISAFGGVV